jgi:hypothetical protein
MSKLDEKAVQDLRTRVRGDLIRPGDGATYEEARKVYNGMIDRARRSSPAASTWRTSSPA